MSKPSRPPGPSRLQLLRAFPRIRREVAEYLRELADRHGEAVFLPLRFPTYMLGNPDDIKHILVTNPRNYHKAGGLIIGRELFGTGLVSGEPPLHTRQRRLMQPMFHRNTIANFAALMTRAATERMAGWRNGDTVELSNEALQLTLTVVGRALFSIDLCKEAAGLGRAFTDAQRLLTRRQQHVPIPVWAPTPANFKYRAAIRRIDDSINGLIAARRQQPESERPDDLLTMLLAARFDDGSPMEEKQLRDECVTLMMAGHETVSNNLCWTWYLLSQHPDVEAKIAAEWQAVLNGRLPELGDLPAMRYTEMVIAESMRLYPPAWILARKVLKSETLPSGVVLPAGSEVVMLQYICHRNAKYFSDPDRFDPERFNPDRKQELPPYVYFPFGGGPRFCIGEAFARMESALVLATIGRRFRLQLAPGQRIALEPLISLRPRHGMRMVLHERPHHHAGEEVRNATASGAPRAGQCPVARVEN